MKQSIRIALAGNPNSGKTTLFNALTGSNQFVGNWPGVTVEKKEGRLKRYENVTVTDLPGIYSLSPYTLEEVVARNYLINERPDAILNIVDGANLERNLYLTTQLTELGIPVVVAVNMMDIVKKNGDSINTEKLSQALGCTIIEISALKGTGVAQAAQAAVDAAKNGFKLHAHSFSKVVEQSLSNIASIALKDIPIERRRRYATELFERNEKTYSALELTEDARNGIEKEIAAVEKALDDDAESIITNERYLYIASILKDCHKRKSQGGLSVSDKIDRVVTNRWLALPIFAAVMFLVYFISVSTVGTWTTDWANDGLFGDGFHLLGIGSSEYEADMVAFADEYIFTDGVTETVREAESAGIIGASELLSAIESGAYADFEEAYGFYAEELTANGYDVAAEVDAALSREDLPDTSNYGVWVPGIPALAEKGLTAINSAEWLKSLVIDGIIGGVGAVLGFVPQMLVLFLLLAFLEACGYMARIAFVLDRVFRKFGLSGKSFIPMLIGVGCSVPGIMASRTIENERDRRMTIMTTTFIPCGAKLPIIALIAAALFNDAWWVAPSAYFIGIAAVIISGIILKKTRPFAGQPAPFVMELPAYHMPTLKNVLLSMWERASSFIKKAGTIILLASIVIWAGSVFGTTADGFGFSLDMELEDSVLGMIGSVVLWIFKPLGFGDARAAIATIMGLVAKEEVVGVFGVLDFASLTKLSAYSFLVFNLLCAPCFAAMGAIKREMNSAKWTLFAILYQCAFAYAVSLILYQIGSVFTGGISIIGLIAALIILAFMIFMLVKPYKEAQKLTIELKM